jgi:hypothetical protein
MTEEEIIRKRMAEENLIYERIDEEGNTWRKVYFGGGKHGENWLKQFKELGDVRVEEVDSRGFACFEDGGENLYRVWLKINDATLDNVF